MFQQMPPMPVQTEADNSLISYPSTDYLKGKTVMNPGQVLDLRHADPAFSHQAYAAGSFDRFDQPYFPDAVLLQQKLLVCSPRESSFQYHLICSPCFVRFEPGFHVNSLFVRSHPIYSLGFVRFEPGFHVNSLFARSHLICSLGFARFGAILHVN